MTGLGPNADERFVDYYAEQSTSEQTRQRIEGVRRVLLRLRAELGLPTSGLDVVDVGCGAGAQAIAWAREGHKVRGIDISSPLIELARKRASDDGLTAEFQVGSATGFLCRTTEQMSSWSRNFWSISRTGRHA